MATDRRRPPVRAARPGHRPTAAGPARVDQSAEDCAGPRPTALVEVSGVVVPVVVVGSGEVVVGAAELLVVGAGAVVVGSGVPSSVGLGVEVSGGVVGGGVVGFGVVGRGVVGGGGVVGSGEPSSVGRGGVVCGGGDG